MFSVLTCDIVTSTAKVDKNDPSLSQGTEGSRRNMPRSDTRQCYSFKNRATGLLSMYLDP
ncbi:hypothetical protein Vi05172_g12758 [Venturia inaequalis]|nr:hypothetical protein Vi05172_g12758 [Venturia inaequalis]